MTEAMKFLTDAGWERYGDTMRWEDSQSFNRWKIREDYLAGFGFAILDDRTIEDLRPYAPLLEVGAGSGYWSYELGRAGIDSLPTDPGTGTYNVLTLNGHRWKPWMPVLSLDGVDAVKKYPERNLLTVWPDIGADWPAETLAAYTGKVVIYVGEGRGGATADDAFHDLLDERFHLLESASIPTFPFIHDHLEIWQRA